MIQWPMQEKAVLVQARKDMLRIIFKRTKNATHSTLALQQKIIMQLSSYPWHIAHFSDNHEELVWSWKKIAKTGQPK